MLWNLQVFPSNPSSTIIRRGEIKKGGDIEFVQTLLKICKGNQVISGRDRPQIVRPNPNPFTIYGDPVQVICNDMDRLLTKIPNWISIPCQGKLINTYFPCSLHIFFPKNLLPACLLSKGNSTKDFHSQSEVHHCRVSYSIPSTFFGLQTVSQLTRWNFFEPFDLPPFQRNFIISFVISRITFFRAIEIEQV